MSYSTRVISVLLLLLGLMLIVVRTEAVKKGGQAPRQKQVLPVKKALARSRSPFLHSLAAAEPRRPELTEGLPAPGKWVKQVAPEYRGTQVYHALYLPSNWEAGRTYPVIVEYAPNKWKNGGGRVDDCRMGFYQSAGRDYLWVVMPFIASGRQENATQWWGDEQATVDYSVLNLRRICETYGGDPNAVFLTGFSRGAIACSYVGLRDEAIADIWLAFLPHSHIDGGRFTEKGARERLARTRGRPTFITYGALDDARMESPKGAAILREFGFPVVSIEIPDMPHSDRWIEQESPTCDQMRTWMAEVLKNRPGTFSVSGHVVDDKGNGLAGARVQCGTWHWAVSDLNGGYEIPALVPGTRALTVSLAGFTFRPSREMITIRSGPVGAGPFVGTR